MELEKILLVDDDRGIRDLLEKFLSKNGYNVVIAQNGREMFKQINQRKCDLVILDLMLPGEDGLELCRKLRAFSFIPVLMLTAKTEETDRIVGLEMGADDYLGKPFSPNELLARIRAVMRRSLKNILGNTNPSIDIFNFSHWSLNRLTRQLFSPEKMEVIVSASEFNLLVAFLEHPLRVLTRDQLLEMTKNRLCGPYDRSIDIQISRIRHKIEEDPKKPALLKTVRGGGYMLACPVERQVGA